MVGKGGKTWLGRKTDGCVSSLILFCLDIYVVLYCAAGKCSLRRPPPHSGSANHAYMSSHSPSSSSSLGGGGGGGGAFSLTRSFLSSGHVACSFSQGAIHSRSNMWFLLHGRRTTSGYSSGRTVLAGRETVGGDRWGATHRQEKDCCRSGSPLTALGACSVLARALQM